jgi:hypothetical protein
MMRGSNIEATRKPFTAENAKVTAKDAEDSAKNRRTVNAADI